MADFPRIDRTKPEVTKDAKEAIRRRRTPQGPIGALPIGPEEEEKERGEGRSGRSFELEYLLSRLNEVGLKLTRFCSLKVLEEYKELVGALLQKAISSMKLEREVKITRRGREVMLVVKEIDEKMAQIASIVASREANRVRITQLVEEIKGCIADLIA